MGGVFRGVNYPIRGLGERSFKFLALNSLGPKRRERLGTFRVRGLGGVTLTGRGTSGE